MVPDLELDRLCEINNSMASSPETSVECGRSSFTTRSNSKVGKFSSSVSDEDCAVMSSADSTGVLRFGISSSPLAPTVAWTKLGN
jgi:hypothetical protein